ncbi:MAG TPA: ATP-dependent helicase HrpB [Acidiferrobacterales bacterium]
MSGLPIDTVLPELRARLASSRAAVLQAPPGAGKTTIVPLALLDEPWLAGRRIVMLEPRRLAARAAAARMAELRGERLGGTVGYRIRFESQVSRATRIEVVTEGILTRRLQDDAALEGVGLVIFDEFHERHLDSDLALALCRDAQLGLREDLKLMVMSATLDGAAVAKLLDDAPLVSSVGRSYPVVVHYQERDAGGPLPPRVAAAVRDALVRHEGDILVFLPGAAEIRRTEELLASNVARDGIEVRPLYGNLPWEAQQRAIRPGGARRKVVLATPIAETSLTIEGVRVVIDSGYARVPQFDPKSGLTRLVTQRISRASAEQRAGRAGRVAPGDCYRLWGETVQKGLIAQPIPEMRSADLAPLALELAQWGVADANRLAWLDMPPPAALAQARALLRALDALDADDRITPMGRAMAGLPVHPRLAHMLHAARERGLGAPACDVAALVGERSPLPARGPEDVDFLARVEALWIFRRRGRGAAAARGIDVGACERINRVSAQLRRALGCAEPAGEQQAGDVGLLLALAYPDRVAQQRGRDSARYLLSGGRGARLPEAALALRRPYVVAAVLDAGEGEGVIQLAAPVSEAALRTALAAHIETRQRVAWDAIEEAVLARREERLGELTLDSRPLADADPEALRAAMLDGIRRLGLAALPWDDTVRALQARMLSMRAWFPEEDWPAVDDATLGARLEDWIGPYLNGVTRREHLARLDVGAMLKSALSWEQAQRLEEGAPSHLTVPSGSRLRLDYRPGESPVLAVKLQEMFGLADTPRVAFGAVPVTLHLLSPARRPIQVTQDLKGFWGRTYAEVKKELKGRYPKHPWPDDPWNATPTARARRRPPR